MQVVFPNLNIEKGTIVELHLEGDKVAVKKNENENLELVCTLPLNKFEKNNRNLFERRQMFRAVVNGNVLDVVRYVSLHGHTGYSLLDGATKIHEMVAKTEWASAITDHGVMYGTLEFYKKMKKANKKPILGFEAYIENLDGKKEGKHQLLLAINATGYRNLVKLTSMGFENKYYKPHVKLEWLEKYSEGVVSTSSCLGGLVPQAIIKGDMDLARKTVQKMIDIFGKENYYIEIQRHGCEEEEVVNPALLQLAEEFGLKAIATSDSHYTEIEDASVHEILLCIGTQTKMDDPNRMVFPGSGYHIHTSEEMEDLFWDMPELLDNTLDLAERINIDIQIGEIYLPEFPLPEGFESQADYFEHLAWEGFAKRFKGTKEFKSKEYRERLTFEIETIKTMGFPGYFVIVWDFIRFAKERGILVGPGRGSACGSLVAYALDITDIDPIPYGLIFERFLNPDRISMPDIDIDFEDTRREEVIDYVKELYGEEAVSRIITFGTLAARVSVKDVARVLNKPLGNMIAKAIPEKPGMTLSKALDESPEFYNMYHSDAEVKEIVDIAFRIEGLPRNVSQHACFDADTLVTTSKGLKKIADIQLGDEVLTHNKRYKPVVDLMTTHTETVYTLKTNASLPVKVTGNHPFYVREMNRRRLRKYKDGIESSVKEFGSPIWKDVSELTVGKDYIGIPINQESVIPNKTHLSLPFDNESFWWVIGRYIGDGWTETYKRSQRNAHWDEDRVIICCSNKTESEKEEIITYLSALNFKFRVEKVRTTYKIHIYKDDLYEYLQEFGKYAHGKHINDDVFQLPANQIIAFLNGYLSADGHYYSDTKRYSFKTVSKELAVGLMQLINKAYHRHATILKLDAKKEVIEGRTVNSKEKYEVSFTKDIRKKEQSFYEDGYIWTRVSSLNKKEESKDMYNLTVLDDSSYVVHGLCAHNCGVIIAPSAVTDHIPQVLLENKDTGAYEHTTQYNKDECEEMGLLKMDFLGLRTMGVMGRAFVDINKKRNELGLEPITLESIPLDDIRVYEYIAKGNTAGVFQLESAGMTNFMMELFQDAHTLDAEMGKQLFERLIAGISLYRPGPLDEIPNYIKNMLKPEGIEYDVPQLQPILETTYNIIVYQEQCMFIVRELANFTRGQSDTIRKGMAKKVEALLNEYGEYFVHGSEEKGITGCVANGIDESIAVALWERMKKFGRYAFNKSHATGYANIAIKTGFLAFYYPTEYMCATLNSFITKADKIKAYMAVSKRQKINVLPPDVNKSREVFTVEGESIRFGLQGIRNMGKISSRLIEERDVRGEFKNFQDCAVRMAKYQKVDRRVLEALIFSGAVDSFEGTRNSKLMMLDALLLVASQERKDYQSGQLSIFDIPLLSQDKIREVLTPALAEFNIDFKLEKEKEFAGFYISAHPLDSYETLLSTEDFCEIGFLQDTDEKDEEDRVRSYKKSIRVAGIITEIETYYTKKDNKPLNVFKLKDTTGEIKCVAFSNVLEQSAGLLHEGSIIAVEGKFEEDDRGTQIMVKRVIDIHDVGNDGNPKEIVLLGSRNVNNARNQFVQVRDYLKKHESEDSTVPVYFIFGGKTYKVNFTHFNLTMITQMQEIVGKQNCRVNY